MKGVRTLKECPELFGWRVDHTEKPYAEIFAKMRAVVSSTAPAGTPIPPDEFAKIRQKGRRAEAEAHLRNHGHYDNK